MASTNPPTPYAASPSNPAPLEDTIQALRRLVNSDLSKDEILLMSKLSAVFISKVVDVFRNEDRSAVDQLIASLEGHPESTLGILIDGVASKCPLSLADRVAGYSTKCTLSTSVIPDDRWFL